MSIEFSYDTQEFNRFSVFDGIQKKFGYYSLQRFSKIMYNNIYNILKGANVFAQTKCFERKTPRVRFIRTSDNSDSCSAVFYIDSDRKRTHALVSRRRRYDNRRNGSFYHRFGRLHDADRFTYRRRNDPFTSAVADTCREFCYRRYNNRCRTRFAGACEECSEHRQKHSDNHRCGGSGIFSRCQYAPNTFRLFS